MKISVCVVEKERVMPPKTKRQRQLESIIEKARESKRSHVTDEGVSTSTDGDWAKQRLLR